MEYAIDGQNWRIGRRIDGVLTKAWVYQNQLGPIVELDCSGNLAARFVYGSKPNTPDVVMKYSGATVTTYRVITNHLGSPMMAVNVNNSSDVAFNAEYSAFGERTFSSGATSADLMLFGFAGGLYDAATGLVRFGARECDPELGRWTNRDPIGFAGQQGNVYLYVGGEPVNGLDADGEHPVALIVAAVAGILLATTDKQAATAAIGAVFGAGIGPALGILGRVFGSAGQDLVHLTGAGNKIVEDGLLLGRSGIYATSRSTASLSGAALTARTGLTAAKAASAFPIPATAAGAFSRPLPVGLLTSWQRAMGTYCTAAGYIDLASGTFVRTGVNWNQAFLYGFDAGVDGVIGGGIFYANAD